jgi:nitrogen fixation NifU-like protein
MKKMYAKKVMELFLNPHNMGTMKNPDAVGEAGNPVCGDLMKIYIKVKDNKIKDIKFETLGCAAAIATSSIITDMAKGKTLEQVEKITGKDVIKGLGTLPSIKVHCSVLAEEALKDAVKGYRKKHKIKE